MGSGFSAAAPGGAMTNPVPRFSVAVIVYLWVLPFSTWLGVGIGQPKYAPVECHRHLATTGLMPGPRSVARTW